MGGAGEANGDQVGILPKATRDESFKRPGAVPFLWELRPGVPRQLNCRTEDTSPKDHRDPLPPLPLPPTPTPPQTPKLAPPPLLVRSASAAPGSARRERSLMSFSNSFTFSKPRRSGSPSRVVAGSNWRFWERGRPARHSSYSGSSSLSSSSSEAAPPSETPSPRRSTGSSETASLVSD